MIVLEKERQTARLEERLKQLEYFKEFIERLLVLGNNDKYGSMLLEAMKQAEVNQSDIKLTKFYLNSLKGS